MKLRWTLLVSVALTLVLARAVNAGTEVDRLTLLRQQALYRVVLAVHSGLLSEKDALATVSEANRPALREAFTRWPVRDHKLLQARCEALEQQLKGLRVRDISLAKELEEKQAALDKAQSKSETQLAELRTLKEQVQSLRTTVADLESLNGELQKRVAAAVAGGVDSTQMAELKQTIAALQRDNEALRAELASSAQRSGVLASRPSPITLVTFDDCADLAEQRARSLDAKQPALLMTTSRLSCITSARTWAHRQGSQEITLLREKAYAELQRLEETHTSIPGAATTLIDTVAGLMLIENEFPDRARSHQARLFREALADPSTVGWSACALADLAVEFGNGYGRFTLAELRSFYNNRASAALRQRDAPHRGFLLDWIRSGIEATQRFEQRRVERKDGSLASSS